ncbi:MAG: alpha/beta fold hydrolase [Bacteroidales bacterium]|jgi:esterase|nr:alpha/beta fold hydrolase [Bacteroidales bacterium]
MQLFYRTYGQGKPFIILHGLFGISDNWVSFSKKIAELGYQVFVLDQRNHGQSPHSPNFNYLALVDDLFEFIDEHELENAVILGHSMGGKVAIRFALENPDYLSKLIVVDISLRQYPPRDYHLKVIRAMKKIDFSIVKNRKEVNTILSEDIESPRIRQFIMKNLYRKEKDELAWRMCLDAIANNLDEMFDGIEPENPLDKPALVVRGGKSDYVLDSDLPPIKIAFPQAEIKTIPNATHWVHAEEPELFFKYVYEFLID